MIIKNIPLWKIWVFLQDLWFLYANAPNERFWVKRLYLRRYLFCDSKSAFYKHIKWVDGSTELQGFV